MPLNRRQFLQDTTAAATLASFASLAELRAAESPNSTIVIGVMGTNGRGTALAKRFAGLPGCKVAYVCDVDQNNVARAASTV
ncbi:MAG TPA: twin-arginine translocation signal domain-containing protein, partial [Pirellulales bacterium]|nr:twin-arginine translocation signal domain-containing protein [Pirellulales bacterium]